MKIPQVFEPIFNVYDTTNNKMKNRRIPSSLILAELLRLQRWAGGDSVSAARIFGLLNGFESVINEEIDSFGISKEAQDKVEDLLDAVENKKQSANGRAIKSWLRQENISESVASDVMQLCRLESRFIEGINAIADGEGAFFSHLKDSRPSEHEWYGATHYIELVDCTAGARKKLHSVFAPAIPRVGEFVKPEAGSTMKVVGIEHILVTQGASEGIVHHALVPYVLLEAVDDESADVA